MRHYCLGGCSSPSVCGRRSRPVRGVRAGTWCCVSPNSLFPPRVSRAACGELSHLGVPYPRSLVRHSTRSVRSACSVRSPFWLSPRAPCVCVHSRSRNVRSPLPRVVWRAHLARSRHWALVGPFHVVRAPPRVLPRSLALSGVPEGGRSGPGSPLLGFGLWGWRKGVPGGGAFHCCEGRLGSGAPPPPTARPLGGLLGSAIHVLWARACGCGGPSLSPWSARPVGAACRGAGPWRSCAGGRAGGGGACAVPPVCAAGGGLQGGGLLCLVPSLCLPLAGNKAGVTGVVLSMGGVAPHTTPVRARPPSLGAICAASWRVVAGSLLLRGSCGSRRLGREGGPRSGSSLGRGEWGPSPLPRGVGAGAPADWGRWGGWGGWSRRGLPAPPQGGRSRYPILAPLVSSAHSPRACACGRGRGAAPGWGMMRGGPRTTPPGAPADLNPPLCPP